jgi:hypothetical protein
VVQAVLVDGLLKRAGLAVKTSIDEPRVRSLADAICLGTAVVNLRRCLSLNVHLIGPDLCGFINRSSPRSYSSAATAPRTARRPRTDRWR